MKATMRLSSFLFPVLFCAAIGSVHGKVVSKVDYKQHVDPEKAKNPHPVDDKGIPICTRKYPVIKGVQLQHFETCSETCEKAYYFKDGRLGWHEYRKCHSCCTERRQTWEFERREVMCPFTGGKMCNGKGTCNFETSKCQCFKMWGGAACDEKRQFANCHAVGDPHYRSFDGLTYNIYVPRGEYVAYYNPDDPDQEAVVNNVAPYYSVAVNRGMAVRRRDEIVRISWPSAAVALNCKDITSAVNRANGKYKTKTGLIIRRRSREVVVTSPSGLELRVLTYGWGQNMFLRIYGTANGHTQGICGNFDGQRANDMGFPGQSNRRQPVPKVLRTMLIPSDTSFLNCRSKAYKHKFETALIDMEDPEVKTFLEEQAKVPREPVHIRKEVAKLISKDQKNELEDLYQTCKGHTRFDAEEECLEMFAKGAGEEFVDCVSDQCELGGGVDAKQFIGAAEDTAGEDMIQKKGIKNAELFMEKEEFKEENSKKAEEGRPENVDTGDDE